MWLEKKDFLPCFLIQHSLTFLLCDIPWEFTGYFYCENKKKSIAVV